MPKQAPQGPAYLDEHHESIVTFADAYIDEDEREAFVDTLMERRGYKRTTGWAVPEAPAPDPAGGGDGAPQQTGPRRPAYFKRA